MKKTLITLLILNGMAMAGNIEVNSSATVTVPGNDTTWSDATQGANNLIDVKGASTNTVDVNVTADAYGKYFNGGSMTNISTVNVVIADGVSLNLNWDNVNGAYSPTNNTNANHTLTLGNGSELNTSAGYARLIGKKVAVNMGTGSAINTKYITSTGGSEMTFNMAEGAKVKVGQTFDLGNASTALTLNAGLSEAEIATLNTADGVISRDLIEADFVNKLGKESITTTLTNTPISLADGGTVVKFNGAYYSLDDVTISNNYWKLAPSAQALTLEAQTVYSYVMLTAADVLAAPKAIGFVAVAPEPATATLSLLALAALASRRRRH